ncbi:MAG: DUF928 domain-containing protein [Pseudomonadota bacterium]
MRLQKRSLVTGFLLSGLIGTMPALIQAADSPAGQPSTEKPKLTFIPPKLGAPAVRVGGASRGMGGPKLWVLAPLEAGWSATDQPVLYWYLGEGKPLRVELTLTTPDTVNPILEVELKGTKAGINTIDLAKQGVRLKPEVTYQWHVALVPDPDRRSNDVVSGGVIQYIPPNNDLKGKLKGDAAQTAGRYAEAGYWYDALHSLGRGLEAKPADRGLREMRASLLEQGRLAEVAAAERKL